MEIQEEIDIVDWLVKNDMNFCEAAIVIDLLSRGKSLGDSIVTVFTLRKEKDENIISSNDLLTP